MAEHRVLRLFVDGDQQVAHCGRSSGRRGRTSTPRILAHWCSRWHHAGMQALLEYIARRRQARITRLFGAIEFDPKYDSKKQRRRR